MKSKLDIQTFIEQHSDWEKLLSEKPYCLEIKRDKMFGKNLVLFKYNLIETSWEEGGNIVRESRGLVLDEDTLEPVVVPFFKFFNAGEIYADKIDWSTAKVTEKIDGSICKIVKLQDGNILIETNSNIDAFKAPLAEQVGCHAKTFGDLIVEGLRHYNLSVKSLTEILEVGKTYIFELTSPYNQVVVRYNETKLSLIGIRDNKTLQEERFEDSPLSKLFDIPKIYDLSSEADCIEAASKLSDSEEGYVVRDANFNRVKIKSPRYLELHHLAGNGILSLEHAIDIIKKGEEQEIIAYFPNFKTSLEEIKTKYDKLKNRLNLQWDEFVTIVTTAASRKEAAIWIQKNFDSPGCGFALLDNKVKNVDEWLVTVPSKNLIKLLGLK